VHQLTGNERNGLDPTSIEEAAMSFLTTHVLAAAQAAATHDFFVNALGIRSGSYAATEAAKPVKES
jgi:hypothetical protein